MLENKYKQITISEHISLYNKIIPQNHFLKKLKENIDFSFVNKLVAKEYSQELGRLAKEAEMMYKLLFLEIKDMLSDREVILRAKTDMAYKYFLDLNPEDELPSYSLLSVFRNTKIKDEAILEEMLKETFPLKPEETATLDEEIEYTKKLIEGLDAKIGEKTNKKKI